MARDRHHPGNLPDGKRTRRRSHGKQVFERLPFSELAAQKSSHASALIYDGIGNTTMSQPLQPHVQKRETKANSLYAIDKTGVNCDFDSV
jgi:hypothetical protein